ncbi:Bifunctional autolysin precursor [Macrococcoides caseolyticum]|uniref:GW dipeptide domain-containing protein n=1 Tax=Macrococcoides caseolyticum TaxID=69966 RepID=UPI000E01AE89|nr:GW dipeptide domain-containing protein [Macrococcus caseolyticus]STY76015.1 Bifunctional autolysin precursor [Macrococcus caseolyticus]
MDNKFYYKTPAALLMMLAGGTTVAHAAEHTQVTPEKTQTDVASASSTKNVQETATSSAQQSTPAQAVPVETQKAAVDVKSQYSLSQAGKAASTSKSTSPSSATATETTPTPAAEQTTAPATKSVNAATQSTAPKTAATANKTATAIKSANAATQSTAPKTAATANKTATAIKSANAATPSIAPKTAASTNKTTTTIKSANTATSSIAPKTAASTNKTTTATKPVNAATPSTAPKTAASTLKTSAKPSNKTNIQAQAPKSINARTLSNTSNVRTLKTQSPSNMPVNEYIKYNNYQVPQYETRYFKDAPQIAYRNGVAKPEGIVAHETANPNSTIEGEISYMSRNINNAFVHAFVDDNNIIETANTDYLSWGAGGVSNSRNINVELVRVYGKDRFSKSINNLADYLATNLIYYNLPVDNAHNDGQGTVWSHQAVSNYLGGTDHSDPVGWFAENNYTFNEFFSLVQEKYNYKLNGTKPTPPVTVQPTPPKPAETVKGTVTTSSAQMMARVNSPSAKVYASVDSATGVSAGQKAGNTYYVNKKATLNGSTYYALTDETKTPRGWVKANDTTVVNRSTETAVTGNFNVNKQATNLYKTPWGTANQIVTNLKSHVGKKFTPTKKVTVGKTNYYFGTVNNLTGWINFNELTLNVPKPAPQPIKVSTAQMVAKVKLPTSKIYASVDQKTGVNASDKANRTLYVNKKATYNGATYYALTDELKIPRGWVKASDAVVSNRSSEVKMSGKYKVNSKATSLYSMPDGTMKQVVKQLKPFIGKSFTPSKKMTVNQSVYVYGTLNNISGWLKQHEISVDRTPVITKSKPVKLIGRTAPKQVLIYKDLKTIKPVTKLIDTQVYVNETAKRNNEPYYKVADNNNKILGWISSKFIKTVPTSTVSWTKSAHTVKKPTSYIYNIPSGANKQRIDKLSVVKGGTLQVIRTDKVGRTLWHKVIYNNNKIGYVSSTDLFTQNITKLKSPTTLSAAVTKQMNLAKVHSGSAPKVVFSTSKSAYNVRNATAAEVTKAMRTQDKLTDPVMKYQFLDLGKSEGINAKTLNKLLVGKGALAGQGAAFAKAAQQFNINEVYLIAHAILETGHGSSRLANGLSINSTNTAITSKGTKYFNMYGAKADDNNPEIGGIKYAKAEGWDNPSKAIVGGAKYVRSAYIDHGQRTLHQMRWNPANPAIHQYATDINWAAKNAAIIANMYKTLGLDAVNYVIHEY